MPVSLAVNELGLPAVALGVAAVHAEELGREERGLLAARAGADLDDDVLVVVGVARQEQDAQLLDRAAPASRLGLVDLVARQVAQLGVRLSASCAPQRAARGPPAAGDRRRRRARAGTARGRARVARSGSRGDLGSRPFGLDLVKALLERVEAIVEAHCVRLSRSGADSCSVTAILSAPRRHGDRPPRRI